MIPQMTTDASLNLTAIWKRSFGAVRKNFGPIVLVQAIAVALVIGYYQVPAVTRFADEVGRLKASSGLIGAFLAGAFAGSIVPEIAKTVTRQHRAADDHWGRAIWVGFTYGLVAVAVDVFYKLQSRWFGDGTDAATLAIKTAVDMFVFSPIISIPLAAALINWYGSRFSRQFLRTLLTRDFYMREVVGAMPLCWAYWIPVLICSYSLPLALQFSFSMLAEGAWTILFVFVMLKKS